MYKLVKRILNNSDTIGYVVIDQSKNQYNITKENALKLAYSRQLINASYNKYTNSLEGVNCDLRTMATVQASELKPKTKQKDIQSWIDTVKTKAKLLNKDPDEVLYKALLSKKPEIKDILEYENSKNTKGILYKDADTALKYTEYSIFITSMFKLFDNYNKTSHLDLSNFNTSNVTDMCRMFYACNVQSIDLSIFNTSNVKDMSCMFDGCEAKSLDLSSFNTSNVTDMRWMFSKCNAKSLDISNFDTSNVESMCGMFKECSAQSIDLSNFNTSNVRDMFSMFYDCKAQSIDLSSFDTSNVEAMRYMFSKCKAQSLNLSSFNTSNVTDMWDMFNKCEAQSLDLSNFDTSNVTVMNHMFNNCNSKIKATDPKIIKAYKERELE